MDRGQNKPRFAGSGPTAIGKNLATGSEINWFCITIRSIMRTRFNTVHHTPYSVKLTLLLRSIIRQNDAEIICLSISENKKSISIEYMFRVRVGPVFWTVGLLPHCSFCKMCPPVRLL